MEHHQPNAGSQHNPLSVIVSQSALSADWLGDVEDLVDAMEQQWDNDTTSLLGYMITHLQEILQQQDNNGGGFILERLATLMLLRFRWIGDIADLNQSIGLYQESLFLLPDGHPGYTLCLRRLIASLITRHWVSETVAVLEEIVVRLRQLLGLQFIGELEPPLVLARLAGFLKLRFQEQGDLGDLEEAIKYFRTLNQRPFVEPEERAKHMDNLADGLMALYHECHTAEDLDEAIELYRQVLTLRPAGHPGRFHSLCNLSSSLFSRFGRYDSLEDLDEAIDYDKEALSLIPEEHSSRSVLLHNLALSWHARFEREGEVIDLERSIIYSQAALTLRDRHHLERYDYLVTLAMSLAARYQEKEELPDLNRAIHLFQKASRDSTNDSDLSRTMVNLASCLKSRFLRLATIHDVIEAISSLKTALSLLPTNHPDLPRSLDSLGVMLYIKYDHLQDIEDVGDAIAIFRRALQLPSFFRRSSDLSGISRASLPSDAAACAVEASRPEVAVELLEHGRKLWLQELARLPTLFDHLVAEDEKLAMEVEALLAVPKSLDLLQWTLVRDQIEVLDGLECWDKVAPFATLQQAAISGPVIVVNISQFRSDAIIVQCHDEPRVVPLPDAEPRDIDKLISRFSGALSITEERTKTKTIQAILRLLWTGIVRPIVEQLRVIGVPYGSRIWWLPTYRLSLLPLHAAGPYKSNMPNLPDIYISSYIPIFETLLRSRHNPLDQFNSRLLVVAHPDPYAHQTLQYVYEEIRLVREVIPVGSNLIGQGTSRDALLTSLQTHRWVHMAAHGSQNLFDPFASSFFRLRDGLLTLLDISSTTLPPVQLAYLSACHSAFTGETPDEAIHLAAAVHFAGFRSVIGSLYAVADVDGPIVAKEVYEHLRRLAEQEGGTMDYTNAAEALNVATRVLRDMRVPVDRWINYVHIGA